MTVTDRSRSAPATMRFCVLMRSSPTSMIGAAGPLPFPVACPAAAPSESSECLADTPLPPPLSPATSSRIGARARCCRAAFLAMCVAFAALVAARAAAACSGCARVREPCTHIAHAVRGLSQNN